MPAPPLPHGFPCNSSLSSSIKVISETSAQKLLRKQAKTKVIFGFSTILLARKDVKLIDIENHVDQSYSKNTKAL